MARRALHLGLVVSFFGLLFAFRVPTCPTAALARVPCPGCGLTRATWALLHGHWEEAIHFHPLVFVAAPLVGAVALKLAFTYVRDGVSPAFSVARWQSIPLAVLLVLLLGVWVARFFGAFGGPVAV